MKNPKTFECWIVEIHNNTLYCQAIQTHNNKPTQSPNIIFELNSKHIPQNDKPLIKEGATFSLTIKKNISIKFHKPKQINPNDPKFITQEIILENLFKGK